MRKCFLLQRIDSVDTAGKGEESEQKLLKKRRRDVNVVKTGSASDSRSVTVRQRDGTGAVFRSCAAHKGSPSPKPVMQYSDGGERRCMSHVTGQMCTGRRGEKRGMRGKTRIHLI